MACGPLVVAAYGLLVVGEGVSSCSLRVETRKREGPNLQVASWEEGTMSAGGRSLLGVSSLEEVSSPREEPSLLVGTMAVQHRQRECSCRAQ